jgi:hypothetical protein
MFLLLLGLLTACLLLLTGQRLRWFRSPAPAASRASVGPVAAPGAPGRTRAGVSRFDVGPAISLSGHQRLGTPSVSVVVPALNEEESIDWVVENIPDWVFEVVLVDGLSVDGTELVVTDRRHDVVVVHQRTPGKGAALRAGFAAASGDIIVMIDADGSTDPREMSRFVNALVEEADFVKGSRNLQGGGSVDFTRLRSFGNLGFVWAANLLFKVRFTDLCYGYCAFWRRDLERLALTADGFEIEMELILAAVKAGLTIVEVPSIELERRAGESNLNAWTDGKRVLRTLLTQRLRRVNSRANAQAIVLSVVELAAQDTDQWRPAGADRRSHLESERRVAAPELCDGYDGPERRDGDRRTPPERTVRVLYAHSESEAVVADRVPSRYQLRGVAR